MSASNKNINYNILNRPRRNIDYKDLSLDSDLLKQFENMSEESDDEEFIPSKTTHTKLADLSDNNIRSDGDDEISENGEHNDSDEDDRDENSDESSEEEYSSDNESENGELNESESSKGNNLSSVTLQDKSNTNRRSSNKVVKSPTENKKSKKITQCNEIIKEKKKRGRKKNAAKRQVQAKGFEMDQEAQKILKSFKNVPKSTKRTRKFFKKDANNSAEVSQVTKKSETINTGPHVKLVKQKIQLDAANSVECPMYVVKQYSSLISEASLASDTKLNMNKINDLNLDQHLQSSDFINKYKFLIPKEKTFPIVNDKSEKTASESNLRWHCSFCLNGTSFLKGIGELFGPYRVSADFEMDIHVDSQVDLVDGSKS